MHATGYYTLLASTNNYRQRNTKTYMQIDTEIIFMTNESPN